MRIKAKDFEIIDELDLLLQPGLTVITGLSNNGKSSIMRLIRSLIFNTNSDSSIQQGKDSYTIGIIDGNNKVIVKRDMNAPNKTVYSVNGNVLKKVGRNVVPEVEDALNIKSIDINKKKMELNFLKQMEYPFLLGETGGFIYDFLSSSSNQTDFTELIKSMKHDLKEFSDAKKHLEGQVDVLKDMFTTSKETYENLEPITPIVNDIIAFDSNMQYLKKLEDSILSLEYADKGIIDSNAKLNVLLDEFNILKDLDTIMDDYQNIIDLQSVCNDIDEMNSKISIQEITVNGLSSLINNLDLNKVEDMQDYLDEIDKYRIELSKLIDTIEDAENVINQLNISLESNNKILEKLNEVLGLKDKEINIKKSYDDLSEVIKSTQELVSNFENETFNINRYKELLVFNREELSTFEVCPLCNQRLEGGHIDE